MELVRRRTLPQGLLGKAIGYALKRWEALNRFVDDGILEIDTNLLENSIRLSALGKKNWLFVGHPEAGGTERGDLHLAGQLSAARDQSFRVSEGFVHPPASRQGHRDQRVHSSRMGQSQSETSRSGSLTPPA
jgi:hypothetical protein